jgi:hypothetical protein
MTETQAIDGVPILVLGSHRSGTSLVTGLLAASGMTVGRDVLEAAPDNPKGFFESEPVWRAHEGILAAVGRDWTRPPATLPVDRLDVGPLTAAVASLQEQATHRWGVKDPRTLFLLEAWMQVVPRVQLIGVVRDPHAIAASIVTRNGLGADLALAVASAYTRRLAALHRHLGFPLVEFSSDRVAVLGRVKQLAPLLELSWDGAAAEELFDRSLIHHTAVAASQDASYTHLVDHVHDPIEEVPVFEAADVLEALGSVETSPERDLDRFVAAPPEIEALHERIGALEADIAHRDNQIRDLREELAKASIRLDEESAAASAERRELEAAVEQAELRLDFERDRHRAAAEALLVDNAALRHWLVENRNTLTLRNAELENERRKVSMLTRFVPKRLAGAVWRRLKRR